MNRRNFLKILFSALGIFSLSGLWISTRVGDKKRNYQFPDPLSDLFKDSVNIYPPGAVDDFTSKCISCGICADVCRQLGYNAITFTSLKDGLSSALPVVKDMRDNPCTLCMECTKVCPTGALIEIPKDKVRMGIALIDFSICLGWNGDVCLSCSKACPLGARVFEFYNSEWGNQPYINENCVGCGYCVKFCPVGGSAIKVVDIKTYKSGRDKYLAEFKKLLSISSEERYEIVYGENLPKILERGKEFEREYQ
ncbi:ferredoxin-type protein NapG [Candidatus Kryptonium thompsonii]|uniref:Ferredoxin-type protein NapG n=1 Tax=Candidatus Kryptonium thompsonii TaxID=1633631 RepID=A0A0N7MXG6_9BACT|nr:4Fe-4S dicluster domain-containing protein [Candidatus Kryptonium thompsoni]CUS76757.1 ferredoxin-type protein NapG [Candidatus Kryptonium thompsoni]CUS76937.1 ferredoxin-type protein NapG [Candidatus Kryptonium thompsoni]CUS80123.1 ferredoxin-type protein NapG [Candidatus Kryptonium thompsoni]CUS80613.1 ferredoxin-type protein NapG [Candidatus Kryptonium thompsoni]CUS89689.1 ferredoxin-type protein NapG [Candidatus Kryptonium thompsoni]